SRASRAAPRRASASGVAPLSSGHSAFRIAQSALGFSLWHCPAPVSVSPAQLPGVAARERARRTLRARAGGRRAAGPLFLDDESSDVLADRRRVAPAAAAPYGLRDRAP